MWLEAEKARNFNAVVWVLGEVNGYHYVDLFFNLLSDKSTDRRADITHSVMAVLRKDFIGFTRLPCLDCLNPLSGRALSGASGKLLRHSGPRRCPDDAACGSASGTPRRRTACARSSRPSPAQRRARSRPRRLHADGHGPAPGREGSLTN